MSDIIYYVAASLDGYIATPDGGVDWLADFESTGEDYGYAAFYASIDAVLLGRRTFEQIQNFGAWPYAGKLCWVFSHQPPEIAPAQVMVTQLDPEQFKSELGQHNIRRAWLVGGAQLAASFRQHNLIDEYIISVIPIILGAGIPLFAASGPKEKLSLVSSQSFSSGIVQLHFTRAKMSQGT